MYKIFSYLIGIIIFSLILIPQSLFAAELLFKTSRNPIMIEVFVNPQSKNMNVIEGTIKFSGPASNNLSVQIENGQSILPIWPTPPKYDENSKSITFVGGVPNGFNTEGLLFKLKILSEISGNLIVTYVDGNGYLNDGKGTKELILSKPLEIYINKDDVNEIDQNSSSLNKFKYVIITLLLAAAFFVLFRHVFKKY